MPALTSVLIGSVVAGTAASVYSSNQQSKAIKNASNQQQQATNQALNYQREARDNARQVLSKYSVQGDAARSKMNTFLGLNPQPYAGGMGAPQSPTPGQNIQARLSQNPNFGGQMGFMGSMGEGVTGWADGSPLQQDAAPDPTQTPAETQETAWKDYQQTPWGRIGQMEADKSGQDFLSRAGAQGSALSGRVVRGTAELANEAQLRNFTGYYGALGGVADTGFNADSGIASGGQTFANSAANVLAANAGNQANLSIAKGQNAANTANDLASWVGWGMGQWPSAGTSSSSIAPPTQTGRKLANGLGRIS